MPTISINRFDGGKAEDVRTFLTNECEDSYNFDIYQNPHKLLPIRNSVDETVDSADMDDIQITDIGIATVGGASKLLGIGYESNVSAKPEFYSRLTGDALNGEWKTLHNDSTGVGTYRRGTAVTYKDQRYVMSTDGKLQRLNNDYTITTVGTASGTGSYPRPFIHPEDNILYIVWGTVISTWDGTTFTNTTTILPTGFLCTSLTSYGSYLAIAMKPASGIGSSVMYLWGRDTSLNTLQGVIDYGDGNLNVIENINDQIIGLSYNQQNFDAEIDNLLTITIYSGGSVQVLKSIPYQGIGTNILKVRKNNTLYFAMETNATTIWCVSKNKSGQWTVSGERYLYNDSTAGADATNQVLGLDVIGDFFFILALDNDSNYRLRATYNQVGFTDESRYKTTINPSMPIADRYKEKELKAIQISYTASATAGRTTGLKYSVDGSDMTAIVSDLNATSGGEIVIEATNENDGSSFLTGREFQFQLESTKGNEIKEVKYKYTTTNTTL